MCQRERGQEKVHLHPKLYVGKYCWQKSTGKRGMSLSALGDSGSFPVEIFLLLSVSTFHLSRHFKVYWQSPLPFFRSDRVAIFSFWQGWHPRQITTGLTISEANILLSSNSSYLDVSNLDSHYLVKENVFFLVKLLFWVQERPFCRLWVHRCCFTLLFPQMSSIDIDIRHRSTSVNFG